MEQDENKPPLYPASMYLHVERMLKTGDYRGLQWREADVIRSATWEELLLSYKYYYQTEISS